MNYQIKSRRGAVLFEIEVDSLRAACEAAARSGANLIGADLIGADLSRADLSGADLIGANLSGAKGLLPNGIIPLQILGTRHALIVREAGHITIGCEHHPCAWWRKHFKTLGRREGYTSQQVREYMQHLVTAERWMRLYGVFEQSSVPVAVSA